MSSSNRRRRRGSLDRHGRATDAWRPVELANAMRGPVGAVEVDAAPAIAADPVDAAGDPELEAAQRELQMEIELDSAYNRGYDDGRAEGAAAESSRLSSAIMALGEAAGKLETEQPRWLQALDRNLVALACGIAREIVGREVKGDAEYITSLVQRAVGEFPIEVTLRIRLNPADLSAIAAPQRAGMMNGRDLRWIPDASVAPGGCVVEGPESIIDGRIEKALEQMYGELVYG
jgi:flagellar assembly protein FliH